MPSKPQPERIGGASSTAPAALAIYVVAAFLTFGHVFNANYVEPVEDCGAKPDVIDNYTAWNKWYWCEHPRFTSTADGAFFPAFIAGTVWPIYWGGSVAIKVTK